MIIMKIRNKINDKEHNNDNDYKLFQAGHQFPMKGTLIFCKVFPPIPHILYLEHDHFDLYLEHDDHMALVEDVAGSVDGHPGEVLDLLWVPDDANKVTWGTR